MAKKRGRRSKTTESFQFEFLDYYASQEGLYKPLLVPSRVMTFWILDKYGLDDNKTNHRWARVLCQYFNPSAKSFNSDKYLNVLNGYRQKYKNHTVYATRDDVDTIGQIIRDGAKQLAEHTFSVDDLVKLQRVKLETQKYLDEKEREDRKELQETIGEAGTWTEEQIEKGKERAQALNLTSDDNLLDFSPQKSDE